MLRLKTPSDNPGQSQQIRVIEASKTINSLGANITLAWVPGHSDIIGNEKADELAKLATKSTIDSNNTSFACLGVKISQEKRLEIKANIAKNRNSRTLKTYSRKYTCKVAKKLLIPSGIVRELGSSFYQLKLGHGYLKSYLYKLGLVPNNRCTCGSIETTEHLLLNCKEYRVERRKLFLEVREKLNIKTITLSILLHTKIGIKETLVFLNETSICTRNWHQERLENREVEVED